MPTPLLSCIRGGVYKGAPGFLCIVILSCELIFSRISIVLTFGPKVSSIEFMKLLVSIFYALGCTGIGLGALHVFFDFRKKCYSSALICVTGFITGSSILYFIWLLLGLYGDIKFTYVLPFLIVGVVLFFVFLSIYKDKIVKDIKSATDTVKSLSILWKFLLICFVGWLSFLGYATLITGPNGDAEACYMFLAKLFAIKGEIVDPPFYGLAVKYGFWVETHFTILYFLGGITAVKVFIFICGVPCGYFSGRIARLCGAGTRGVIIVWIMVYTSSVFTGNFLSSKTDSITCALGMAGYFWLIVMLREDAVRRSILVGVLIGSAILSKISYVPILGLPVVIWIGWDLYEKQDGFHLAPFVSDLFKYFGIIGSVMFLCFIPHFLKNYLLFDNALAPFNESSLSQVWFNSWHTAYILKSYPLAVCFGIYPMQAGTISPLVLVSVPFFFLSSSSILKEKTFLKVFSVAILSILAWKIVSPSMVAPRYIMACFFLLAACGAVAIDRFWTFNSSSKYLKTLLALSLILSLLITGRSLRDLSAIKCVHRSQIERINEIADKNSSILLYGYYGFYLRDDLLTNTDAILFNVSTKENALQNMIQKQTKYIVVQSDGMSLFKQYFSDLDYPEFKLVLIDNSADYKSYRVDWNK